MNQDTMDQVATQQWKSGWLQKRDGESNWTLHPTQLQFLHWDQLPRWHRDKLLAVPYGIAQMDNGEVIILGTVGNIKAEERTVAAFSRNGGESWSPWQPIGESVYGRPMATTYLGAGSLMYTSFFDGPPIRYVSEDYGRTWRPTKDTSLADPIATEGNYLVDRNASRCATQIAAFGLMAPLTNHPVEGAIGGLQWSMDNGRTWTRKSCPEAWQWEVAYQGQRYRRGALEGSFTRAANGWIVGAFRTDQHPRYFAYGDDNHCGMGVSLSKDNGETWSPMEILYEAGRQHTHLLCMPNGTLVLTFIQRLEIEKGELVSYRRGCGALTSFDNGLTWNTEEEYLIHSFDFSDGTPLGYCCGHVYSTLLEDESILTCYGNFPTMGACVVRWRPIDQTRS